MREGQEQVLGGQAKLGNTATMATEWTRSSFTKRSHMPCSQSHGQLNKLYSNNSDRSGELRRRVVTGVNLGRVPQI